MKTSGLFVHFHAMHYNLISTGPKTYFLFEIGDKVILKQTAPNSKITITHNCIDPVWEFEIESGAGHCIYDNENCIIYFEKLKSTFINIANGRNERTENRYYFLKKDYGSVYISMDDTSKIVIENENQFQIPLLKSSKWFRDRYLIQRQWANDTLLCTDLHSGNELWNVSPNDLDRDLKKLKLQSEISFYKDTMYFSAGNSETDLTLCIHVQTGEVVRRYPDLRGFNTIVNDTLYNLFFDELNTLHIPTGERKTYSLKSVFSRNNIESADYSRWLVHQGMLYFIENAGADMYSGTRGAKVVIMDISTKEIIWQYTLPLKSGLIGGMNIEKNRLFISTQDSALYIFET